MDNGVFIKPVVCIPIHTSKLSNYEMISIKSHLSKLKLHDVFVLLPRSKKTEIISVLEKNNIPMSSYRIHEVKDYCLRNADNFQLLMLTRNFYLFYKNYSHILIAQIDAYTFSDELIKWCKTGFHFIGAPCFEFEKYWTKKIFFYGVGGFSLRNINKILEVLERNPVIFKFNDFRKYSMKFNLKGKFILFLKYIITKILKQDRIRRDVQNNSFILRFKEFFIFIAEDKSYAYYLPKYHKSFKIGELNDSISFCIDSNVKEQLKKIPFSLPFGAHAWFTYPENLKGWKNIIDEIK